MIRELVWDVQFPDWPDSAPRAGGHLAQDETVEYAMAAYVLNRVVQTIPVLFLATIAAFLVLRLIPGDPAADLAGENATPEDVRAIRRQLGLTNSLPEQYVRWLGDLVQGDFGKSFRNGLPVRRLQGQAFPPTIELAVFAYAFAIAVGIPLGVLAGVRRRSGWDWLLSGYTTVAVGIPSFLAGIILLWIFAVKLNWLPAFGRVSFIDDPVDSLRHLILPAVSLGLPISAVLARYTRTTISDVIGQDFIRTARAKGLRERNVVVRHALRNSLIPVITIMALQIGAVMAGAVVVEQVFTRPGVGRLMLDAILNRDYLVVQSTLVILVVVFVIVNLLADVAYGLLDPRVRYQ